MSWEATAWAVSQKCGSPQAKVVLLVLANRHNPDTGQCDPEISRIAREAEISVRSVYRVLQHLEESGFIERERRSGGHEPGSQSNNYRFPALDGESANLARSVCNADDRDTKSGEQNRDITTEHASEHASEHATAGRTYNRKIEPKERKDISNGEDDLFPSCKAEEERHKPALMVEELFHLFYEAYPRKVGKGAALKAYRSALKKKGVTADLLLHAAGAFRSACEAEGKDKKFIPHPATWLNGERWADEDIQNSAGNSTAPHTEPPAVSMVDHALEIIRRDPRAAKPLYVAEQEWRQAHGLLRAQANPSKNLHSGSP